MSPHRRLAHNRVLPRRGRFALLLLALAATSILLLALLQPATTQAHPAGQSKTTPAPLPTKSPRVALTLPPKPRAAGETLPTEVLSATSPAAAVTTTVTATDLVTITPTVTPSSTPIITPTVTVSDIITDIATETATAVTIATATVAVAATESADPPTASATETLSLPAVQVESALLVTTVYTPTFEEIDCPFVVPWSQTIICGSMSVPEIRSDPASEMISLFVMILKSQSTPLTDPIFVLPGGPGGAGSQSRSLFYTLPSHRNRDIVLLDPRGTGHSYPSLDCFEVNAVGMTYADSMAASRACYDRLVREGRNLAGYASSEQMQDVVDLAKVLGFGKINLYATSYGTRVAVQLADKYPRLVRSMVLDGVLPVAVNSLLEEPLNDYGAIQRIARDCALDPRCNGSFPALEARLLEVIDRYNHNPLPDDIGYGNGDAILKFIFKEMYDGGRKIPAFITALYYEDYAEACTLLPPAVGCFFDSDRPRKPGFSPYPTVRTELDAWWGIDLLTPEITTRWVYTWDQIMPVPTFDHLPESTPSPEITLTTPASDEIATAENSAPGGLPDIAEPETPPWRAHFDRPEDPLSPDLDRISWLLHDLGYARPQQLFAYLDTLSRTEIERLLRSIPEANFDSFSEGAYASVMCAEEAPFYTLEDIAELSARIPQQFGSLPTRRATEVKMLCEFWQVPTVSAAAKMTLPSGVPTLITNGTHDAITPAVWAERAAIYLDTVWLRLFPGYGHAILSTDDTCMQEMMALFYSNPAADPTPTCFRNLKLEFFVP